LPEFALEMAICTPLIKAPGRSPATPLGPYKKPIEIGVAMTNNPGKIISRSEAFVEI
jgi:hypothetical protein